MTMTIEKSSLSPPIRAKKAINNENRFKKFFSLIKGWLSFEFEDRIFRKALAECFSLLGNGETIKTDYGFLSTNEDSGK